jgi:predicted enzyme related to lactoylglutathione lyase
MAHTIVHFEIPSDNIERAKKFYNDLFGWKMEKMPGPTEYWTFATTPSDKNSDEQQNITGGVMDRQMPQQSITNYISVKSVDDYSKKVEGLGGKVKVPKTEVLNLGWFAICTDTENNTFGLWETKED